MTHRWVAPPAAADSAARSFVRALLRRRSTWLLFGVLWLASGYVMTLALDEVVSPVTRAAWGYAWATAIWAVVLPPVLLLVHRANRRRFGARLGPGTELTSRFGPSSVVLAGPMSRSELTFAGLEHVEPVGGWVHLRQVASPVILIWPGDLFPEHELARMQQAVGRHRR